MSEAELEYAWFFRAEFPQVARIVFLILRDRARAEDIAQEAFIHLLSHWNKVSRPSSSLMGDSRSWSAPTRPPARLVTRAPTRSMGAPLLRNARAKDATAACTPTGGRSTEAFSP